MIQAYLEGNFKGGESLVMTAANGGVALPATNPNLEADTMTKADEALTNIVDAKVTVPSTVEDLNTFLTEQGYTTPAGVAY